MGLIANICLCSWLYGQKFAGQIQEAFYQEALVLCVCQWGFLS